MKMLFALAMFCCLSAHARTTAKKMAPPQPSTVEVNVSEAAYPRLETSRDQRPIRMDVQVSTWKPAHLTVSSRIEASEFSSVGMPQISTHFISHLNSWEIGSLSGRFGGGFQSLERRGNVPLTTVQQESKQSAQLIPLFFGVDAEPSALTSRYFSGHFGLGVLPTFVIVERSAMSQSSNHFGIGYEISAGLSANLKNLLGGDSENEEAMKLHLSAAQSLGTADVIDFNGFNVQAALSWALN
jgi:hypothetical protein